MTDIETGNFGIKYGSSWVTVIFVFSLFGVGLNVIKLNVAMTVKMHGLVRYLTVLRGGELNSNKNLRIFDYP